MKLAKGQILKLNAFWKPFGMKYCNFCTTTKDFSQFSKQRGENLQNKCKQCMREYRQENYEKLRAYDLEYRSTHVDQTRATTAARYARNAEKKRAYASSYRAANPEKIRIANASRWGRRDANKPWRNDYVGYNGAHDRVKVIQGRATTHTCSCGRPAQEWAYDNADPNEFSGHITDTRTGELRLVRWSADPNHYMPMCHSCHVVFDKKVSKGKEESK